MEGNFARSKAGHDKGRLYIIVGGEGEYVYLADGCARPVERPKKKNRKHIQIILREPAGGIREKLAARKEVRNEEIKRSIKLYETESQI